MISMSTWVDRGRRGGGAPDQKNAHVHMTFEFSWQLSIWLPMVTPHSTLPPSLPSSPVFLTLLYHSREWEEKCTHWSPFRCTHLLVGPPLPLPLWVGGCWWLGASQHTTLHIGLWACVTGRGRKRKRGGKKGWEEKGKRERRTKEREGQRREKDKGERRGGGERRYGN